MENNKADRYSFPDINPNPVLELDREGRVIYANPAVLRLFPDIKEKGLQHPWLKEVKRNFNNLINAEETSLEYEVMADNLWFYQSIHYIPFANCFRVFSYNITNLKNLERKLWEEASKSRMYLDIAGVIIVVINSDQKVSLINKKGADIMGYKQQEIIGKNWFDNFIPEKIRDTVKTVFSDLVTGKIENRENFENPVLTKNGKEKIIAWHNTIIKDNKGIIIATMSSGEDVTERKQAEVELKKAKSYSELLFKVSPTAIFSVGLDRCITGWNDRAKELTGYSDEEVIGKKCTIFMNKPCQDKCGLYADDVKKPVICKECIITKKDGQDRIILKSADLLTDEKGNIIGGIEAFEDITDRRKDEERIKESERKYRNLIENIAQHIFTINDKGVLLAISKVAAANLESTPEKLIGKTMWELFPKDSADNYMKHVIEVFKSQKDKKIDISRIIREEEERLFSIHLWPVMNTLGETVAVQALVEDVTDQKKMERLANSSMQRLVEITDAVPGAVYEFKMNPDGNMEFLFLSGGVKDLFGVSPDDILKDFNKYWDRILPEDTGPLTKSILSALKDRSSWNHEFRIKLPDGSIKSVLGQSTLVRINEDDSLVWDGAFIDITERKKIEESLREREAEMKEAQRLSHVGSWKWDVKADIISWSEELFRLAGLDPKSPTPTLKTLSQFYTPESWARLKAAVEKALQTGESYELELDEVRLDGSIIPTLARGEVERDASGQIVQLRGTVQDLTERKKTEEILKAALREKEILLKKINKRDK